MRPDDSIFRQLVDAVDDEALFMIDPGGRVLTWGRGAERSIGYALEEAIGRSFEMFYCAADIVRGVPYEDLEIAAREGRLERPGWRISATGQRYLAHTSLTAVRVEDTIVGFACLTRAVPTAAP